MLQIPISEEDVETMVRILDNRIRQIMNSDPHGWMTKTVESATFGDRQLKGRLESALDKARAKDNPI
jgi:hypothetical protein